jgi:hypothetical protein
MRTGSNDNQVRRDFELRWEGRKGAAAGACLAAVEGTVEAAGHCFANRLLLYAIPDMSGEQACCGKLNPVLFASLPTG